MADYTQPNYDTNALDPIKGAVGHVQRAYFDVKQNDLFQLAFGYVGVPYLDTKLANYVPFRSLLKDAEGQPMMLPLKLDGYMFPYEPTVEISGSRRIVEAMIDGRVGTYKESYRTNDWAVEIKGVLVNNDNPDDLPEADMRELIALRNKTTAVEVTEHRVMREIFGINFLAIEDIRFPALPGFPNVQPYVIKAKSDALHESYFEYEEE